MNYGDMLSWLQNLLSTSQSNRQDQFQQGIGFEQQQLGQQGSQFGQTLAQQQSQFQAQLAAQLEAQRAATALAQEQQGQAEQAQQFGQAQTTRQTSFPYLTLMSFLQRQNSPEQIAADNAFMTGVKNRNDPMSSGYAYGIPVGQGNTFNPYQNLMTSNVGIPIVRSPTMSSQFAMPSLPRSN
jgi:hypothetical protein